jgi:hypothetical protein
MEWLCGVGTIDGDESCSAALLLCSRVYALPFSGLEKCAVVTKSGVGLGTRSVLSTYFLLSLFRIKTGWRRFFEFDHHLTLSIARLV